MNCKIIRKCILLGCVIALACGLFSACGSRKNDTIRVVLDWTPNTNHTGLYVALEKGYFTEQGLTVELLQPPDGGALPLVAAANAEFAISFQEEMGAGIAKDNPFPVTAVAAIIQHNTSGVVSLTESEIRSPKDLEGKRFAAWNSPLVRNIIRTVVEEDGGDFDKVEFIPNNVTDVVSALQANVDAVWVFWAWDGLATKLALENIAYFRFTEYYPVFDYYTPVIVGNNAYLENNPEEAKRFLAAVSQGYEFAIQNPKEAADSLLKQVPELDPALIYASQEFLANEYQAQATRWGEIDPNRWGSFYHWMYEEGLLENDIGQYGQTNQYLPAAD